MSYMKPSPNMTEDTSKIVLSAKKYANVRILIKITMAIICSFQI